MTKRRKRVDQSIFDGPGVFYGYMRVSDQKQVDSGLSLTAQREQLEKYFAWLNDSRKAAGKVELIWGDIFEDKAVSAFAIPFTQRAAGGALNVRVQPGDHIAMTKLDRGFRSTKDIIAVALDNWLARGVGVHLLDMGVDLSTPIGALIVKVLATVAEFESEMKGERQRAVNNVKVSRGLCMNAMTPVGTQRIGLRAVRDGYFDVLLGWFIHAHDVEGKTWYQIARECRQNGIEGSTPGTDWSGQGVERAYHKGKSWFLTPVATRPLRRKLWKKQNHVA